MTENENKYPSDFMSACTCKQWNVVVGTCTII